MTNGRMNPRWYMPRFCGHLTSIWQGEPWLTTKLTSETSECYTTQVFCLDLRAHPGAPHQEISRWLKYQVRPGLLRAKPTNGSSKTWLQRDESQTNKWQQNHSSECEPEKWYNLDSKELPNCCNQKNGNTLSKEGFHNTRMTLWYVIPLVICRIPTLQ